jgi:hypothetical protein
VPVFLGTLMPYLIFNQRSGFPCTSAVRLCLLASISPAGCET